MLTRIITETLPIHNPDLFAWAVRQAVAKLQSGELVALPTETVYGLAANALDAKAVARIFSVKGRPTHNPIIVHIASLAMAQTCVRQWPSLADKLAAAFWPGPLTLVLPRSPIIPDVVTAGGPTVGVRWPSHPFIQAVIRDCGFPLAAPSANPANQISPTLAEHVQRSLDGQIPLIIDGGSTEVGLESTVLDLSAPKPCLLRPGMVPVTALELVIGDVVETRVQILDEDQGKAALRSPGLLRRHYAPKARLVIWQWRDTPDLAAQIARHGLTSRQIHVIAHTRIPQGTEWGGIHLLPREPEGFARGLYAALHHCDEAGAHLIVVEALPFEPHWQAILDRLQRAAAE